MEIPTIKIKGSEIIERWKKAKELTKKLGSSLGEKGYYYHRNGYDVWNDGFNSCTFGCKDIDLSFRSYNWTDDHHWELANSIYVEGREMYAERQSWMYRENHPSLIIPDEEYEFKHNYSLAELFEKGFIHPTKFKVTNESNKAVGEWWYFDTFEEADKYARDECQRRIERRFNDPSCRQYYMTSVRNNEQEAKECHELRHYSWYQYEMYDHWMTVRICD